MTESCGMVGKRMCSIDSLVVLSLGWGGFLTLNIHSGEGEDGGRQRRGLARRCFMLTF